MIRPLDNSTAASYPSAGVDPAEAIPVYVVHMYRRNDSARRPWVLFWYDPPTQTRRRRFRSIGPATRREADKLRRLWQCELNGCRADPTGEVTWRRFVAECLAAKRIELAPASVAVLRHVLARFGSRCRPRLLSHVGRQMLDAYRLERIAETSVATARKDLRTLSSALGWAVYAEYLDTNPCEGIRWGGRPHRAVKPVLSTRQTRRFLERLDREPVWLAASLRLAALWGPRTGDLVRIRPGDVDLGERMIWLRAHGGDAPKHRRERAVPVDEITGGLLQELMHRPERIGLLWGPLGQPFRSASGNDGYRKTLIRGARRILADVGFSDVDQPVQMLRRTAETEMRRRGVSREVIARVLGHTAAVGDQWYDGRTLAELLREVELPAGTAPEFAQQERNVPAPDSDSADT